MESIYSLIERAQNGDLSAKEKILNDNSGLIWKIVKRFYGRGESDDLYQIGAIGLLKCIDKFDFSYQVKFSTYAVPMIAGEIRRFLRDDGTIKVSRSLKELAYRAKKLQNDILQQENREPSISELAEIMDVEPAELILALESAKEIESLYSTRGDSESGNELKIIDQIYHSNDHENLLEHISLKVVLDELEEKEKLIIFLRYYRDKTQAEVAKRIGISQVQVSRIEKRILNQIKESLE